MGNLDSNTDEYWLIIFLKTRKIPESVWYDPKLMDFFNELFIAANRSIAEEYISLQ